MYDQRQRAHQAAVYRYIVLLVSFWYMFGRFAVGCPGSLMWVCGIGGFRGMSWPDGALKPLGGAHTYGLGFTYLLPTKWSLELLLGGGSTTVPTLIPRCFAAF
mmetsp:Transcript_23253/g.65740  ORF Transcript_23253/g.65740 Transcript_23253/m.65740 type:complete len:103 (+) Transcript_23253:6-314(+)